jgi:uncharacterized protein (TIGR04255 family)
MDSPKHYTKAPITEALIDLRVEMPDISSEVALSLLKGIQHGIESEYPVREDIVTIQSEFQSSPSFTTTTTQTQIGFRFLSEDKKQIFQARLDGFTFSRLSPYKDWATLKDEAKRLWELYKSATYPKSVNRVAVRYLNRLDLPLPMDDFKDYLRTVPEVSPDLPQGLSDYFMRLIIPQSDLGAWVVLQEALIPSPPDVDNVVSVVLDIDLVCEVSCSPSENSYWDMLERLRVRKNEIFEACITDKTRRLIK